MSLFKFSAVYWPQSQTRGLNYLVSELNKDYCVFFKQPNGKFHPDPKCDTVMIERETLTNRSTKAGII